MRPYLLTLLCAVLFGVVSLAQDHNNADQPADASSHEDPISEGCEEHGKEPFNPGKAAFHHISDQNIYNIGPFRLPLPCMLYSKDAGWSCFLSGVFKADVHGNGHYAYDRYVLIEGRINRITDAAFPMGKVALGGHPVIRKEAVAGGKKKEIAYVCNGEEQFATEPSSKADGGVFGGGITSFYDFSITKNVASMIIVFLLLAWMFISIAKAYRAREGKAPKGIQSLIEPVFLFIQDEVAKPFMGRHWERFTPFLMSLFFFILGLNLFGQIPFLGGSNVTGNIGVTAVLAIITFIVVNINGNKNYWRHVLWMPGVPAWVKTILTPVEVISLFIKPITLMLRLFANITAGHMVIVIFVGLIFLFGKSGELVGQSLGTAVGSTLLTMFMMSIELLVAFIQAFVFTILTASYIGAATEDSHH